MDLEVSGTGWVITQPKPREPYSMGRRSVTFKFSWARERRARRKGEPSVKIKSYIWCKCYGRLSEVFEKWAAPGTALWIQGSLSSYKLFDDPRNARWRVEGYVITIRRFRFIGRRPKHGTVNSRGYHAKMRDFDIEYSEAQLKEMARLDEITDLDF